MQPLRIALMVISIIPIGFCAAQPNRDRRAFVALIEDDNDAFIDTLLQFLSAQFPASHSPTR